MPEIVVGPYGDSNKGTNWSCKPSGPISRIELVGDMFFLHSITVKSNNNYSQVCGKSGDLWKQQNPFQLGFDVKPSEYLTGIKGVYTLHAPANCILFLSLSFETNLGNVSGPWPQPHYTRGSYTEGQHSSFSYKTPDGSRIVGFHGFHGCNAEVPYINAIGVYVEQNSTPPTAPSPPPVAPPPPPAKPVFVDEWGGSDGKSWKFLPSGAISQIVIFHGKAIHSLSFKSQDGEVSEKIGGNGGNKSTIDIKTGASLTGIKGTFAKRGYYTLVTSLIFYTSDGIVHGPFGEQFGTEFSLSTDGSIAGFHGHAGGLVNAVGVYLKPAT